MPDQRHIIRRQVLEVTVPRAEDSARLLDDLSRIVRRQVVPLLDRHCSELCDPGQVVRIDSMEIDLGTIDVARIEGQLASRVAAEFRRRLAEEIDRQHKEAGGRADGPEAPSDLELFEHFARKGRLPWWADPSSPHPLDDAFDRLVRRAPDSLRSSLLESVGDERVLRRLIAQLDDDRLAALLRVLIGATDLPFDLPESLRKIADPGGGGRRELRSAFWRAAILAAVEEPEIGRDPSAFRERVLRGVADDAGLDRASFVAETLQGNPVNSTPFGGDHGAAEGLAVISDRLRDVGGPFARLFEVAGMVTVRLPDSTRGRWLAALRRVGGSDATPSPEAAALVLVRLLGPLLRGQPPLATAIRACLDDLRRRADGLSPDLAAELAGLSARPTRDDPDDDDEIDVRNAGLVILWPFLRQFFGRLGLLEDERFRDEEAAQRAVGLLGHLATGEPDPFEPSLPLAKVLCGRDVDEVFDFGPPVSETEAEECEDLLRSVIGHAPILRDMSVAGFRGSFLIRRGLLGVRDGAWLLRVERETYDVVLDRFPWAWAWLKLPWMEAPLRVEW